MNRPWDDCKFYLTTGCRNQHCKFRHSETAKSATIVCASWAEGSCKDIKCPKKHLFGLTNIACRFEFSPGGCTNSTCTFKHTLPRNIEDNDLQKKLAQFLAEHEKSKQVKSNDSIEDKTSAVPAKRKDSVSSASSEYDLAALREQALKTKTSKEGKRKIKGNGTTLLIKKSKNEAGVLTKRIQKVDEDIKRRITSKSEYSEDEVSDLSLDELTDEEPEDLRATLNKKKSEVIRISKPTRPTCTDRLIRKVEVSGVSESAAKDKPRMITLRKNVADVKSEIPSEWVERKVSAKRPQNKVINRLITIAKSSESEYSDATQSDDSPKRKRKPNLAWCNVRHAESTEEPSIPIRKRADTKCENEGSNGKDVEFTRKISVRSKADRSIQNRLGHSIKSRLGPVQEEGKKRSDVKTRLKLETRLGRGSPSPAIMEREKPTPKKKIVLKRKNTGATSSQNSISNVDSEPPIKIAPELQKSPARDTKSTSSPLVKKQGTKTSSGMDDLEDELLGDLDDDLEIGNEIEDDELFL